MHNKVLIFDVDDTIINIKGRTLVRLEKAKEALKLNIEPNEIIKQLSYTSGLGYESMDKIVNILYPQVDQNKLWQYWDNLGKDMKYASFVNNIFFDKLSKNNNRIGIITNGEEILLRTKLKDSEIDINKFEFLFHQGNAKALKPSPLSMLKILEVVERESIIFIGDGLEDCNMAKEANISFIAVLSGLMTTNEFINIDSHVKVIPDITYLIN